ncbi:MAG: transglutaminase family protein [Planctomycetaceae bacterium]|nr:transglutaminase family protein [Planctomycetaceae bacterium]
MRYRITHNTSYLSREPISVGHNQAWLRPRDLPWQSCDTFDLQIEPTPSIQTERSDAFGNTVYNFSFNEGYDTLCVTAVSEVTIDRPAVETTRTPAWNLLTARCLAPGRSAEFDALQFCYPSPLVRIFPEAVNYVRTSFVPKRPIGEATKELMQRMFEDFEFDPHATTVSTPVEEVFTEKRGVCQDFAHVLLALLRALQLPCRYVSGYLRTDPPPGKERLVGADASHAWVSVYCGSEVGWIDFDPTNNMLARNDHLLVGWGRDYSDLPPLRGVYLGGSDSRLEVSVDVAPL